MTINISIQQLLEQIKQGRLNKDSDSQLEYKQGLLQSLKLVAKEKQLDVIEVSNDVYLDVVKKRFNVAKSCAITIVSKSDKKDIGTAIVPDLDITYDQLTLEQILTLNPTNSNLDLLIKELEYLGSLLPKQLTEDNMMDIISKNKLTNIKDIMGYFKANYPNQYDNKLLANVAKTIKLV